MLTDPDPEREGGDAPRRGVLPLDRRTYLKAGTAASILLFGGNVAARGDNSRSTDGDAIAPTALRVDYEQTPNNIDPAGELPRFFWELPTDDRGVTQSAYRVLVADSASALQNENGNVWDRGKVASDESTGVE